MADVNFFQGTTLDPNLSQAPETPEGSQGQTNFFQGTTLDPNPGAEPAPLLNNPAPTNPVVENSSESEPDYSHMAWSEVGSRAIENLGPSVSNQAKNILTAVTHPVDTGNAILTLGKGVAGKTGDAIVRAFGNEPKKWDDKEKSIAALDNVLGHYKDTYGSVEGFKKGLATDPAAVGMDVASLAPVVGAGVKAAGLGEKVANAASKTVSLVDPIQTSMRVAKTASSIPPKIVGAVAPVVQGAATGVPSALLKTARGIGESSDATGRAIYRKFLSGNGDVDQIADTASKAVAELKDKAVQQYLSDMGNYSKSTKQLPLDSLMDSTGAPQGVLKDLSDYVGQSGNTTRFPRDRAIAQSAYDQVLDTITSPYSSSRTFVDLDNLKRSLQDLAGSATNPSMMGKINAVADHLKQMIMSVAPEYEKTMSDFQKWSSELRDFKNTLGAGNDKLAATTKMSKILRATKTAKGRNLFSDLGSTNAGKYLPHMLAGTVASPLTPPVLRGVMETGLIGVGAYFAQPAGWMPLAAAAVNTSPRIASAIQYGTGAIKRNLKPVVNTLDAASSQPVTYGASIIGNEENREGRAYGGVVNHETEADALIRAVHNAKALKSKETESFLSTPDESIVKALSLANKYS